MRCAGRLAIFAVVVLFPSVSFSQSVKSGSPSDKRIEHWTTLLPDAPRGVGPTIEDRREWEAIGKAESFKDVVAKAEQLLTEPIPELTDDIYLEFSRTGSRTLGEKVFFNPIRRITKLVWAECIENKGRFIPGIEEAIRVVCTRKTWVLPAHDRNLTFFNGTEIGVDLYVAAFSWNLATARYWLGHKLSPEVCRLIDEQLERRTFAPFVDMVVNGKPSRWWLIKTHNWNSYCLAGVTGAALATIESRSRRAFFAAAAEKYIQNFVDGYTSDGYCAEGVGYWSCGFGAYVELADTLRQASGGQVDLLAGEKIKQISMFGRRMEILPGIYPAFADCHPQSRPSPSLMAFLNHHYGWGLKEVESRGWPGAPSHLFDVVIYGSPHAVATIRTAKSSVEQKPPRDWFPEAVAMICRPAPGVRHGLGAAIQGGDNGSNHNHNDVGVFLVALGESTPITDPGNEVYTRRTFNEHRYESNALNSFGHSVPRVAGHLQSEGSDARAKVLDVSMTDKTDTLTLDLTAAYPAAKELKKLVRTFVFSREGRGKLTVTDRVEFNSPQSFDTALITYDAWKQIAPNRLLVGEKPDEVVVNIDTHGIDYHLHPETIKENMSSGRVPTRLGIELDAPTKQAVIEVAIRPAT